MTCSHMMLATDAAGVTRCCDCGKVVRRKPGPAKPKMAPRPDWVEELPPHPRVPQPGEAAHMFMMMRNMTRHAGNTVWANMINEAADFFEEMVHANKLEQWRPNGK